MKWSRVQVAAAVSHSACISYCTLRHKWKEPLNPSLSLQHNCYTCSDPQWMEARVKTVD